MRVLVLVLAVLALVVVAKEQKHGGVIHSAEPIKHFHPDGSELPVKYKVKVHSPVSRQTFLELGSSEKGPDDDALRRRWEELRNAGALGMDPDEFDRWFSAVFNSGGAGTAPPTKQCEGLQVITTPGEITDGSGSGNYENDLDCKWLIKAPAGKKKVTLTIKKFSLEQGYDHMFIYSVPEDRSEALYTLTGEVKTGAKFESNTGEMLVEFITDYSVAQQGFVAQVDFSGTSVDPDDVGGADGPDARITSVEFDMRALHRAHKTDKYRTREEVIVIRRGNPMQATITTSEEVECDKLNIIMYLHDAEGRILSDALNVRDLGFEVKCDAGKKKTHQPTLIIPSDAAVGHYKLAVKLDTQEFEYPKSLAVLFNPWCRECAEYWPNDVNLLREYVMSENIGLWRGSSNRNGPMRWSLDHFDKDVFYGALEMLQGLSFDERRSCPLVIRQLSKVGGNGVLWGKWASDESEYDPYTKPWEWTGSQRIMAKWREGGAVARRDAVRYAQCWVFSGMFTSVMRALGLPARSVTNFESAHERKPFDFNVDMYYVKAADGSDDYTRDRDRESDSVWNFHVWNDVWIGTRTDCENCDGWQATDATPQEESDGTYQLGPVPLKRIYDKNVKYEKRQVGYDIVSDTKFIVSESNADKRGLLEENSGSGRKRFKHHFTDTNAVGKQLSCNRPLRQTSLDDVTDMYKPDERGRLNRVWVNALSFLNEDLPGNDVTIEEDYPTSVKMGSSFSIKYTFALKETAKEERRVEFYVSGDMVDYTGQAVVGTRGTSQFKVARQFVHLKPGEKKSHTFKVDVDVSEYAPWAGTADWMEFSLSAQIVETKQRFINTKDIQLVTEGIQVVLGKNEAIKIGQVVDGAAVVKNPFFFPLENVQGQLHVSGQDVDIDIEVDQIAPFGQIVVPFAVAPNVAGQQDLIVKFTSDQLSEIQGSLELDVQGEPGESRDAVATLASSDAEATEIQKEEAQSLATALEMQEGATQLEPEQAQPGQEPEQAQPGQEQEQPGQEPEQAQPGPEQAQPDQEQEQPEEPNPEQQDLDEEQDEIEKQDAQLPAKPEQEQQDLDEVEEQLNEDA